jgi:hypothetical protein
MRGVLIGLGHAGLILCIKYTGTLLEFVSVSRTFRRHVECRDVVVDVNVFHVVDVFKDRAGSSSRVGADLGRGTAAKRFDALARVLALLAFAQADRTLLGDVRRRDARIRDLVRDVRRA